MENGDFFKCDCGRKQSYASSDMPWGITEKEAESIGWRLINGKWRCPFCCGNTAVIEKIFYTKNHNRGKSASG